MSWVKQHFDLTVPTFRYPGGKALLASVILSYVPKQGRRFIDVYGGRGNITFRAIAEGFQYETWIINDINTAAFLCAVRDFGDHFKVTEKTKEEFNRLAELATLGDPHALLMAPYLCFNGGTYDSGGSTTEGGRRSARSYEQNVHLACRLLREKNVRISALDWLDCLEAEELGPEDTVIVDGPYIGCEVGPYSAESICPAELVECLQSAPFVWVLTEYRQPFYVAAFGEPVYQREVQLRTTNFAKTGGQERRVECIWLGPKRK